MSFQYTRVENGVWEHISVQHCLLSLTPSLTMASIVLCRASGLDRIGLR